MSDLIEKSRTATKDRLPLAAWSLRVLTSAGLAVDAVVHAHLVGRYDPNQGTAAVSQGDLFRVDAIVSGLVALALLLSGRRVVWVTAWLVAASGLGAMLLYRYHDPGALGPLPDMFEPLWFREKALAGVAEGVALVTATLGLLDHRRRSRRRAADPSP